MSEATGAGSGGGAKPRRSGATRSASRRVVAATFMVVLCTLALLGLCATPAGAQAASRGRGTAAAPARRAAATTVILVRHAEKAAQPADDPPLTAEGEARARALVDVARQAGVTAIVTTSLARTRGTVRPLAGASGITPEEVDPRAPGHPRWVAELIRTKHAGEVVLVAGHSNTIPAIVEALGAPAQRPICDWEYDGLYVVTLPPSGPVRVIHARYGAPSSGEACEGMR